MSILVVRTDRIGDVVLSLPVVTALRRHDPDMTIAMLVHRDVREIVEDHPDVNDVLFDDGNISETWRLVRSLRKHRFDAAILLHATPRLALVLSLSRIPIRIGTGYRAYSFLFNRRVWEHRKISIKHESEYNLSLTAPLGVEDTTVTFRLPVSADAMRPLEEALKRLNVDDHRPLAILHPGTRGSAMDWPLESFARLADGLVRDGAQVIITGGQGEKPMGEAMLKLAEEPLMTLVDCLTLKELTALFKKADLVVANSTGPLHIAVAVGTRVVGIYPPVIAMSPTRWGPYEQPQGVVVPEVQPCKRCREDRCAEWNCMEQIPVQKVLRLARDRLREH